MKPRTTIALPAILALAVTTAACGPKAPAVRGTMIVAGAALIVGGVALHRTMFDRDAPSDQQLTGLFACAAGGCLMSGGAVFLGTTLALSGLFSASEESEAPPAAIAPVITLGAPGAVDDADAPRPPPARALPELATDEQTLRMAQQVRSAALRGDCLGVSITLAAIARRDPRYHAAVVRSTLVDGCR